MQNSLYVNCRDEGHAHLPPVEPLHVEIGESESLLAAGTVSSILEGTIVVQVPCRTLSFGSNTISVAHVKILVGA